MLQKNKKFLLSLENKKIAYFGTAGFGGSNEYYIKLFNRVKSYIKKSNKIIGYFYCQGKMPEKIRQNMNISSKNIQMIRILRLV